MRAGLCDWVTDGGKGGVGLGVGRRGSGATSGNGNGNRNTDIAWDGVEDDEDGGFGVGGEGLAEWGRGGGLDTVPWRLRDRQRREKEECLPDVMRGLKGLRRETEEGEVMESKKSWRVGGMALVYIIVSY
jgi:hypothetical protein